MRRRPGSRSTRNRTTRSLRMERAGPIDVAPDSSSAAPVASGVTFSVSRGLPDRAGRRARVLAVRERSDAARRGVVEHGPHQVADREDPDDLPASTTGRCLKPPWIIRTAACSVVSSGSIVSGVRRHEVAHRASPTCPRATARSTSRSVKTPCSRSPARTSTAPTPRSSISRAASASGVAASTVRSRWPCARRRRASRPVYEVCAAAA